MKCCIQNCRNNGKVKKLSNSADRITFHLIPKHATLRASWAQALSLPNCMSLNRTVICSDHFKETDFYITKQGTRRIKYGVVPFIEENCFIPASSRVCKLCLSLDSKMYQLNDSALAKMYQDIMGIVPRTDANNQLPMGICWECTARLQSAASFRSKALFCDALLQDYFRNNTDLNIIDIQNLHRQYTNLKPSMAVQEVFKFNSHNSEEHAPNTLIKSEVIGIPHNDEIEIEVQNLVRDKITIKDEEKNEIIEENCPNSDVKTEIDLIPITEIAIDDKETDIEDFSDNDNCIVLKENGYVSLNNIVLNKSEGKNEKHNLATNITVQSAKDIYSDGDDDLMDFNGDIVNDDDSTNDVNKSNIETSDVKKTGTVKIIANTDDVILVKGKRSIKSNKQIKAKQRAKSKQPFVKPMTPIDDNIFTVKNLNHDDLRREILARRDSDQYKFAPFKCDVCFRGFPTLDKQARHVIKHSEQCGPINCNICNVRMTKSSGLRAHIKGQHTTEYKCKLCPFVTRNRGVALGHMKYHNGSKFKCPQCLVEFEKQTTFLSHLRLKHMSASVCELCGYTFVNKAGVDVHKRMKHKFFDKNTEFKGKHCDVCDVKFLNDNAYKRHLRLSSKHITEDDPKRMSNDPSIKDPRLRRPVIHRQEQVHATNGPITCEQCGVVLKSLRSYSAHFTHSHPGINRTQFASSKTPYMCEHCGKFFLNITTLSYHMCHTRQKGFQCDHCHKSFSLKANLASHMQQHEAVRRTYDCRVCGKRLTFRYNLARHMFLHTGLRPFKCDTCEKTFRTSDELRYHVNYVHLKKPRPKRVRRKARKCEIDSLEY